MSDHNLGVENASIKDNQQGVGQSGLEDNHQGVAQSGLQVNHQGLANQAINDNHASVGHDALNDKLSGTAKDAMSDRRLEIGKDHLQDHIVALPSSHEINDGPVAMSASSEHDPQNKSAGQTTLTAESLLKSKLEKEKKLEEFHGRVDAIRKTVSGINHKLDELDDDEHPKH